MKHAAGTLAIGLFVGIAAASMLFTGALKGWQEFAFDRLQRPGVAPEEIVVVEIDEMSLREYGPWPMKRTLFADVLLKIAASEPRVIGLDVEFAGESMYGKSDDRALRGVLKNARVPIVLSTSGGEIRKENDALYRLYDPSDQFFETAIVGHTQVLADPDSVIRSFPGRVLRGSSTLSAFPLKILEFAGGDANNKFFNNATTRIRYEIPPGGFRSVSFAKVARGDFEDSLFENRIVLIGATAPSLQDVKPTPLGRGRLMAGVEIHGNIIAMGLRGRFLELASVAFEVAILIIVMTAMAFLFIRIAAAVWLAIGAVVLVVSDILFSVSAFRVGILHQFIYPAASVAAVFSFMMAYRYFTEGKEKRVLEATFAKYVSPDVLKDIIRQVDSGQLVGVEKNITVFFMDIRSFTALSEKLPPEKIVTLLNGYFEKFGSIILENGGVVDKFIGDAIMAFWGAPLPHERQADAAVGAARRIITELPALNAELAQQGLPSIRVGIGIASGPAIVGNIGFEKRLDYTAIGDTVNTASRIEGLTKQYGVPLLISESTKIQLRDSYALRRAGVTEVKGKSKKVIVWSFEDMPASPVTE